MPGLDPSIILAAKPPQLDPLATMSGVAALQNARNQNSLFQARALAGKYAVQATDANGATDPTALNKLLLNDPRTAPFAQEAQSQALSARGAGIANTTAQTNLTGTYSNNLLADVARIPPDPSNPDGYHANILAAITNGVKAGRYPQDFAANFAGGGQLPNGATLDTLAKSAAIAGAAPHAMEAQFGTTTETTVPGGGLKPITVNPVTHEANFAGGDASDIKPSLTPGEKASPVTVLGADNAPRRIPLSAVVDDQGNPKPGMADLRTGLAPGVAEAGSVAGQQSAQMATQLVARAAQVPQNKAILGNMEGLLDNFTPGPQSGFWKGLNQVATQYGLAPPGSPPQTKAAAQEEFGKLAFQLAQSQFTALGGTGTDAKLESTMHTSPSELLTRYGSKGIIALLKGNEDAAAAQNSAWQKWEAAGHGPETYTQFVSQWSKIFDPRVFQAQYMNPAERQTMLKGMTATEQAKFKQDYARAAQLGWVGH